MSTDSIADMLTRIRNANTAGHSRVAIPASRVGVEIARVLKEEGYIASYDVATVEAGQKLDITFKPKSPRGKSLAGLRRISKPGLRIYARKTEIPRVLGGVGLVVLSTSMGVMGGRQGNKAGLGGEVLCDVCGAKKEKEVSEPNRKAADPGPRGGHGGGEREPGQSDGP